MNDQEILLRLRRQYSKDEAIAACNKEIARLGFELGVERSDVAELKDTLSAVTSDLLLERKRSAEAMTKLKAMEESVKTARAIGRAQEDQKENKRLRKELKDLAKKFNSLRSFLIANQIMPPSDYYLIENNQES